MPNRVLATDQAKQKIVHARGVIEGPFLDQITTLRNDFSVLKNPNEWDGVLADRYRDLMNQAEDALAKAQTSLVEFTQNMGTITNNILMAGGN